MNFPAVGPRIALSDAHGHVHELLQSLRAHGVIDRSGCWTGGTTRAWILGDYLDRGAHGLAVVDVVRELAVQAPAAGGRVVPLLGNHELQFLAALYFGDAGTTADLETSWLANWFRFGGVEHELADVTETQVAWMADLPLLAFDAGDLLMHSDTDGYLELGDSVEEINAAGRQILAGRNNDDWAHLHRVMTQRGRLLQAPPRERLMDRLGAHRIVHGHNTLIGGFGLDAATAARPYAYGDGRVLAIDGGVFEGGSILVADL